MLSIFKINFSENNSLYEKYLFYIFVFFRYEEFYFI